MELVFASDRKREDEEAEKFVRAERIIQSRTNELAAVEAFEHNGRDEVSTAIMSESCTVSNDATLTRPVSPHLGIVSLAAAQSIESGVPGQLENVVRTVASE